MQNGTHNNEGKRMDNKEKKENVKMTCMTRYGLYCETKALV